MLIGISIVLIVLLICSFRLLLKQSKKPTGFLGILMMRLWNTIYLPLVKWTTTKIELPDHSTILDIGVGNGISNAYLLEQRNTRSVTGIDISEVAISQAKRNYSDKMLHFEKMDIHDLTFDSETFDLVTAFQTHFHWDDLEQALHEIYRVLKQDGAVIFACESAKINYFLPKLKKSTDFQKYMSQFGFSMTSQSTTDQWIMYTFKKIK